MNALDKANMLKVYENKTVSPAADIAKLPLDQILIQGLVIEAQIGLFDHELGQSQPVRFDVTVDILPLDMDAEHATQNIVRYDHLVADIKTIVAAGHIDLVETLAEQVALSCLAYDRAFEVCVTVSKLAAIDEAEAVGVKITRRKA